MTITSEMIRWTDEREDRVQQQSQLMREALKEDRDRQYVDFPLCG